MLAILFDFAGSFLLTKRLSNLFIIVPLALLLGVLSSIMGTVLVDLILSTTFLGQGSAQRMISGFLIHPPICIAAIFWFRHLKRKSNEGKPQDIKNSSVEDTSHPKKFYEMAWKELEDNEYDKALWSQLFSETDGDENKTKAKYIKERVQTLLNKMQLANHEAEIAQKRADTTASLAAKQNFEAAAKIKKGLKSKGFKVKDTSSGWRITYPLGGFLDIRNLEELESFSNRM